MSRRAEERHFFYLFDEVFTSVNGGQVTDEEIDDEIGLIIARFRGGPTGACAVQDGETLASSLAFFLRYSPLSAGVTLKKTLAAVENCEEFRACFNQPMLKIVSLGGGSGSDLVGLYSAIYLYSQFKNMEVLLIDNNSNWEPFFQQVNKSLRKGNFGNASLLMQNKEVSTSFNCADLTKQLSADLRRNLRDADIIFIKGVLSIMNENEITLLSQNIISSMTEKGFLVIIDSPYYLEIFERWMHGFERVFGTNKENDYQLVPFPDQENSHQFARSTKFELLIFKRKRENVA